MQLLSNRNWSAEAAASGPELKRKEKRLLAGTLAFVGSGALFLPCGSHHDTATLPPCPKRKDVIGRWPVAFTAITEGPPGESK